MLTVRAAKICALLTSAHKRRTCQRFTRASSRFWPRRRQIELDHPLTGALQELAQEYSGEDLHLIVDGIIL